MKALKIVFMLSLVVILSSVAVFFVEDVTSQAMYEREQELLVPRLNAVFPGYAENKYTAEEITGGDYGISGVTSVFEVNSGTTLQGYVYFVSFQGFANEIKYAVGIDVAGTITGYQILAQSDTPGYGAQIGDEENWKQFTGMLFSDAGAGNFDGLTGATQTTNKWKASLDVLYDYHVDTYGEPDPDQIALLKKAQLVPEGAVISERVLETVTTDKLEAAGITQVDIATLDGEIVAAIYTVEFDGFQEAHNKYFVSIDLENNQVIKYIHIESGDTLEYGGQVMEASYWDTLTDKTADELFNGEIDSIAGVSGAPVTTEALQSSLTSVSIIHFNEFTDTPKLSKEEQLNAYITEMFPTADTSKTETVTDSKVGDYAVKDIYDIYNASGDLLGSVYHANTIGIGEEGLVVIEFLVGIDPAKNFTGIRMYDTNGVTEDTTDFYMTPFINSLDGISIEDAYALTVIADSPNTFDSVSDTLDKIVYYHLNKYWSFPEVDVTDLEAVYPNADHFESIYQEYTIVGNIVNLYGAYDETDTLIGHVYYAQFSGFASTIKYIIGVDLTDTLTGYITLEQNDSAGYGAQIGDAVNWTQFTDMLFSDAGAGTIDGLTGATETTDAWKASLSEVYTYHTTNSVGGGE